MFDNIGQKIMAAAKVIFWLGIAYSAFTGFVVASTSFFAGLLVITIGALLAWYCSLFIYGFGRLIDNSETITRQLSKLTENKE